MNRRAGMIARPFPISHLLRKGETMKKLLLLLLSLGLLLASACAPAPAELPLDTVRNDILHTIGSENATLINSRTLYTFYGITAEDCVEMAGFQKMQGIFPDECVMIRAADRDAAERVENAFRQRLDQVLAQSRDYDPEGYAMAKECRVMTDGLYVRFFLSSQQETMEEIYTAYRKGESRPVPPAPATPTPRPTPEPTPMPEPEPEATPEPTPEPWPRSGKVPETPRADDSWFDDVIFIGDSVENIFSSYIYYIRGNGEPNCFGKATLFTAPNFSWHLAVQEAGPGLYFPIYNGRTMSVEDAVEASGAKKVLIGMGMNDIALVGLEKTMGYVDEQIRRIQEKTPEVTIYLMSMTPRPAGYDGSNMPNALIREFNALLLQYAEEHGLYYLDCYEALADEKGELPIDHCADPYTIAVHPSYAGCAVWLEYLYTHAIPDEE